MHTKFFTTFTLIQFIFGVAIGNDQTELKRAVNQANRIHLSIERYIGPISKKQCSNQPAKKKICPKVLLDEEIENSDMGLVGTINKVESAMTSSDDFSTPNNVCKNNILNSSLPKHLSDNFQEYEIDCDEDFRYSSYSNKRKNIAVDYISSLAIEKKQQLTKNINDLLAAHHQINLLLGTNNNDGLCNSLEINENKRNCEELSKCSTTDSTLFHEKSKSLFDVVVTIRSLKQNFNHALKSGQINSAVDDLLEANPLLKTKSFKKVVEDTNYNIHQDEINTILSESLLEAKKNIIQNINQNNLAYLCLIDKNKNCQDFSKLARTSYSGPLIQSGETSSSYQCLEYMKAAQKEANSVLNDVALSAALSFAPGGALRLGRIISKAVIAGNTLWATKEALKISPACEEKLKLTPQVQNQFSCVAQKNFYTFNKDSEACTSQMISAGVSAIAPLAGAMSIAFSKSKGLLDLIHSEKDQELKSLLNNYLGKINSDGAREIKIFELEKKINSLLHSDEKYSEDEIKAALKIMLKQCF